MHQSRTGHRGTAVVSEGIGFLITAAVLALIGYLIKVRRWAWLISGYNTSSKATKERYDLHDLTRGVGHFMFLEAAILVAAGIGALAGLGWTPIAATIALVATTMVFLVYANTGGRYRKRP